MNPMKNGQVFAKKCLVRFLPANHLTIEACTWARQSNVSAKAAETASTGCQHKSKGNGRQKLV